MRLSTVVVAQGPWNPTKCSSSYSSLSSFPQVEGDDLATRGLCMDKKAIPRLLAPSRAGSGPLPIQTLELPSISPCQGRLLVDVFTSVSPQIFRDTGVGRIALQLLHLTLHRSTTREDHRLPLALHFAVFGFLRWEQWGKRGLYSHQWLAVRTQITYFTLYTKKQVLTN